MLSISLPEHTLRAALESVSKAHSNREEDDEDSGSEGEGREQVQGRKANKGLMKNSNSSPGRNTTMKINEMFERAKVLLPSVRYECTCVVDSVQGDDDGTAFVDKVEVADINGESRVDRKEWTIFSFCYECGRTSGVHLVKCPGCRSVSYCSRTCRSDNWKKGHQKECSGTGAQVKQKDAASSPAKGKSSAIQRTKVTKRANSNTT